MDRALLEEQLAYYRARAPEYDEWFLRLGRYDRGEAHRRAWFAEVAEVEAALRDARPLGRVLELACGTGLWTRRLLELGAQVTAVDAAPEALRLNEERVGAGRVRYLRADLFEWEPGKRFDVVFFGFWLSHVPPQRFERFWAMVRAALRPGGRAFFVDNARSRETPASDSGPLGAEGAVIERRLNDGRRYRVVKVFYEPPQLAERLRSLGFPGYVRSTGEFFVYGCVRAG